MKIIEVKKPVRIEGYILEESDLIQLLEADELYLDIELYEEYCHWTKSTDYGRKIYEGRMSDLLLKVTEFVKMLANKLNCKIRELFKLLKDKFVFSFFQNLGWNWDSLLKLVSVASSIFTTIMNPIGAIINLIFPDLVAKTTTKLNDLKQIKNMRERMKKFSEWAKKNKKILMISGIAFAGLYLIIWLTMNNTGDVTYDFDISDLLAALTGKITFFDWVMSEDGFRQLILFGLAVAGIGNSAILANIATSGIQLTVSLIRLLLDKARIKLQKGKDKNPDEVIHDEVADLV